MAFSYNKTYHHNRHRRKKPRRLVFELVTALLACLLIFCAYSGKFNPDNFFPAPFLTLAFMPMLIFSAVVLVIALICRRFIAVLTLVLAFFISWPVFSQYVPLNSYQAKPAVPVDSSMVLKVMTYNVLSFNYNDPTVTDQACKSMKLILEAAPDVVMLQEGGAAGINWIDIPSLQPFRSQIMARYPYTYSSPEGLNIMSRYPFVTKALGEPQYLRSALGYNRENYAHLARAYDLQLPSGKQLRLIDFRLQSYHLSFGKNMNIRISPDVKPSPLERMKRSFSLRGKNAEAIRQAIDGSTGNLIVCGDMNDVTTSHVYRVIKGNDMTDAWAEVGNGYAFTFNRHHLPFRIDHILYRGNLQVIEAQRIKGGSSDHYPLMATFDISLTTPHVNDSNNSQ